ncbi:hypothetical protein LguiB_000557 [Lonicera macranthoides]
MDFRRRNYREETTLSFRLLLLFFSLLCFFPAELDSISDIKSAAGSVNNIEIPVGVIVDEGSWVGKTVEISISIAISDFYELNSHYKTRVVLHTRNSEGDPLRTLSAALDLLENNKVKAIIGPQTSSETKLLAILCNKAKLPILSFTTTPSSFKEFPYFVRVAQDERTQFKGIANVVESFKWRNVILIYEDSDYGRETITSLVDSLREKNIHVSYKSAIFYNGNDDLQIIEELHKLMTMQMATIIVHVSSSQASLLFLIAKKLGMMSKGYAWIVTDRTINLLHSLDPQVIESMQGVLGFKSYVPLSVEMRKFSSRWKKEFYYTSDPYVELRELNVYGLWAYDAIFAVAKAVEKIGVEVSQSEKQTSTLNLTDLGSIGSSQTGTKLLNQILTTRFKGLSGEFEFTNGRLMTKAFEIVNVIGNGERRVGIWEMGNGSKGALEAIIWPGMSTKTPKGLVIRASGNKKLRIGVPVKRGFTEFVKVAIDPSTNAISVSGFCIDVFTAATKDLEDELDYEFVPFADASGKSAAGSYNDLIYQVYLQVCLFSVMVVSVAQTMYNFRRNEKRNMWIFLKPLDTYLWLTSASFFILTGFVVWVIEHPINVEFQGSIAHQIGTVIWFSFSTLVFAHMLILTSSYTATLSSLLTVQQIDFALKGNQIGYQLDGVFVRQGIYNNFKFREEYNSSEDYADALKKGSKNGGVDAIIDEIPYIKSFLAKYSADYAMISSDSTTNGFGFVFPKGSPLVPEISRAIAKLRQEGKLTEIEDVWFRNNTRSSSTIMRQRGYSSSTISSPNTLNLDSFREKKYWDHDSNAYEKMSGGPSTELIESLFVQFDMPFCTDSLATQ